MEFVTEEVKSAKKVVAKAKTPVFASIDEAVDYCSKEYAGGDAAKGLKYVIDLVTTQNATNIKNKLRSDYATEPGKGKLREQATDALLKLADTDIETLRGIVSDPTRKEEWLQAEEKRILDEYKARRDANAAALAAAEEGETEE